MRYDTDIYVSFGLREATEVCPCPLLFLLVLLLMRDKLPQVTSGQLFQATYELIPLDSWPI